ncbi:PEP-CTERM sorting domain-containing protein [Telluria beijingensis]|uniref:PEP-CTERM sorting domain-containing protein n=1 Tax=Telluria beijingensis TaxID=3068633 RepID=UPI00279608A5|nr:PEP-CTERM sorting domain-containing protein [Massilia sp. REN29]
MSMNKFAVAAAIAISALAFSGSANAVILTGSTGANSVTDYSEAGLVSFDLDLHDFSTTTLNFVLEEGDLAGPLSFNAIVRNLVGLSMYQFSFVLQGIGYAAPGSVDSFSGAQASHTSNTAVVKFPLGETTDLLFGNPTLVDGSSDWLLDTTGLSAGDSFSIVAQVPEPSTVAMMLPLMAGLLLARRRKRD